MKSKTGLLLIFLWLALFPAQAQNMKALYFNEINGSTWLASSDPRDTTFVNGIALSLWNYPLDSLKKDTFIWSFADSLTVQQFDAKTKSIKTLLTCAYTHETPDHRLAIFPLGKDHPALTYEYLPISTGSYVGLHKPKLKKKKKP